MKETRVYSHEVFFCVLIILFLIGLVFSRKTKQVSANKISSLDNDK